MYDMLVQIRRGVNVVEASGVDICISYENFERLNEILDSAKLA